MDLQVAFQGTIARKYLAVHTCSCSCIFKNFFFFLSVYPKFHADSITWPIPNGVPSTSNFSIVAFGPRLTGPLAMSVSTVGQFSIIRFNCSSHVNCSASKYCMMRAGSTWYCSNLRSQVLPRSLNTPPPPTPRTNSDD
jgi:hypothetical protein